MTRERSAIEAFNAYATTFDETVGDSPVVRELRKKVYAEIRRLIPTGNRILDINCGTGTDCVALAELGYSAYGVDLAPEMVARARRKVRPGLDVRFEVKSFTRLDDLERRAFDLVLSNNSGLNCSPDLRDVLKAIHVRLRIGSACILVVMPPFSLWECVAGLARANVQYARRRGKRGTANIGGHEVDVWYYGELDFRREAAGLFEVERIIGLNIISPSPNSLGFISRRPGVTAMLATFDRWISGIPVVRRWGDQILVVLRKIGE